MKSEFNQYFAWVAWCATALFIVYQICVQNAFGSVQHEFAHDLGLSQETMGLVSASFFITYAAMQFPAGILIDRYGVGWLIPPATLLVGVGSLLLGISESAWMAVFSRLVMGLAGAFSFLGVAAVAHRRISEKRLGIAIGMIDFAFGVGVILGAVGIAWMMTMLDWRTIFFVLAALAVPVAIVNWFLLGRGGSFAPAGPGLIATFGAGVRASFGNLAIWEVGLVYAAFIGIAFGIGGLWNIPLQHAFHRDESAAQELTTIMFASFAIMAPICGFIADKTGRHITLLLAGCLLAMYAIYNIVFVSERAEFWVVQLQFLLLGVGLSTGVLVFAVAFQLSDRAHAGTVAGLVNGLGLMGSGLFQLIPGVVQKETQSSGLPALQEGMLMYLIWPVVALILLVHLAWKEHMIKRNGNIGA